MVGLSNKKPVQCDEMFLATSPHKTYFIPIGSHQNKKERHKFLYTALLIVYGQSAKQTICVRKKSHISDSLSKPFLVVGEQLRQNRMPTMGFRQRQAVARKSGAARADRMGFIPDSSRQG